MWTFGSSKLSVLIDGNTGLFSERLICQLGSLGLETEELILPKKKIDYLRWTLALRSRKPKIVHYLWGNRHFLHYLIPKLWGKKVVIHWLGSDVLEISSSKKCSPFTQARRLVYLMADLHLAVSEPLADELRLLGIKAEVVPLVPNMPIFNEKDLAWPSANRVHVYLPERRQDFYGADIVFRLAKEMPDTEFLITSHSGSAAPNLPNLKYLGWVNDMEEIWSRTKVLLRLTKHDGLPQTLIEALTRGRYVIWSNKFPHCIHACSFEEAKRALIITLSQKEPNLAGMSYARREFEPSKIAQSLKQKYLRLVL